MRKTQEREKTERINRGYSDGCGRVGVQHYKLDTLPTTACVSYRKGGDW